MSKHHHQNKAEQIYNKAHGAPPFHNEKIFYETDELMEAVDAPRKTAVDDKSVQLQAYQIYRRKGGPALDNWLEAERSLKNKEPEIVII